MLLPIGVLAAGDAKESDLALSGEIRAGPSREGDGLVGPTLEDDVSVNVRYHGFRESKWWETVNENREDEHDPIFAADGIEEGSNRRDDARGYDEKSLNSKESSKSREDTTIVAGDSSRNGRTPCNHQFQNIKRHSTNKHVES